MHFILVTGPYDATVFGPFRNHEDAATCAAAIPSTFDYTIMTETELRSNFNDYGPLPIQRPHTTP